MKVKHLIGWVIYFSVLAGLILLMGCEKSDLERRIEAWQTRYPNRSGDCMIYAMKTKAKYDRLGVPARICHGYWKGKSHAWCEYLDGDEWLVDDKAIGNKGYEREAYKYYELTWWGE